MGAALLGGSEKVQKPPLKTSMLNLSLHCMLKISSTDECVSSSLTGPLIKSDFRIVRLCPARKETGQTFYQNCVELSGGCLGGYQGAPAEFSQD